MQDVLPTTAQRYDVAVAEFEKYLLVSDIHGLEEKSSSITVSTSWATSVSNIFEPVLRQGPSDRDKQALSFRA